jgi:hypothetical protein
MTYIDAIIEAGNRGREDAACVAHHDVDDAALTRFATSYSDRQLRRVYLEAFVGALIFAPSVAISDADGGAWVLSEHDLTTNVRCRITPAVGRWYVAAFAPAEDS